MVYKEAVVNTINSFLTMAFSLIFALIVFRAFPPEEIGKYYTWVSLVSLIYIFSSLPYFSILYIIPKNPELARKLITATSIFLSIFSFFAFLLMFFFIKITSNFLEIFLLSILSIFVITTSSSYELLFTSKKLNEAFLSNVLSVFAKLFFLILFLFMNLKTFFYLALSLILSDVIKFYFLTSLMKSFSINEIKQLFITFLDLIKRHREGFYFYITSIVNSINLSIDTLMGSFLLGFRDLGIYNIASNISKYLTGGIPSALSFFIFPIFLREEKREHLSTGILIVAFFVIPLVISSLYGEPFIKLIAGGYEEYATILFYFLPLIILSPLEHSLLRYFTAKKNFFFFKYLVIATIINILLNYFFVKEMNFGVNGLAIATSISYLVLSFLIVFNARDILPKMFPIKIIFIGVTLSFILFFFIPYFKKSFSNEIEAMIYAFFSLAIAYSLNTFLIYILFKDDFKNLLKKILGLIKVAINKQKWLMKSR